MALKGTKNIALSYQSMIGDQVAVYMTAQIPESGRSNSNKTIQDLDLYEANKTECRADMALMRCFLNWKINRRQRQKKHRKNLRKIRRK